MGAAGFMKASMQKILSHLILVLILIGTSDFASSDEEGQLLNTNSCVNCDLSNACLEKADLGKANLSDAKFYRAKFENAN